MKIVIWNDDTFSHIFKQGGFTLIHTEKQLIELSASSKEIELLIILLELNYGGMVYDQNHGIKIIKNLRLRGFLFPIVSCSFMPLNWYITESKNNDAKVLKTPGHHFFRLPIYDLSNFFQQSFDGLDKHTLEDINRHIFDLEGQVDEIFHDLENEVVGISEQDIAEWSDNSLNTAFRSIEALVDKSNLSRLGRIKDKLREELLQEKQIEQRTAFSNILEIYKEQVKLLINKHSEQEELKTNKKGYVWKILYLEDKALAANRIQVQFRAIGIDCDIAYCAEDVFKLLKTDEKNQYVILICDYRLLEKDEKWQKLQGYKVIEKVSQDFENYLAYFSLSYLDKSALLNIQQQYNARVWTFPKSDIMGSIHGFNILARKIIEEGDKIWETILSIPPHSVWKTPFIKKFDQAFKIYYRWHREAQNFEIANYNIGKAAEEYTLYMAREFHQLENKTTPEILTIQEGIGKDLSREEKLNRFRTKLIGRRIAIALYELILPVEDKHLVKIRKKYKGEVFTALKARIFAKPNKSDNVTQLFNLYLGLSLDKDLKKDNMKILPEERTWLISMREKIKNLGQ